MLRLSFRKEKDYNMDEELKMLLGVSAITLGLIFTLALAIGTLFTYQDITSSLPGKTTCDRPAKVVDLVFPVHPIACYLNQDLGGLK